MHPSFGILKSPRNWALVGAVTLVVLFMWHTVARAALNNSNGA